MKKETVGDSRGGWDDRDKYPFRLLLERSLEFRFLNIWESLLRSMYCVVRYCATMRESILQNVPSDSTHLRRRHR